jgi:hypothetical protein
MKEEFSMNEPSFRMSPAEVAFFGASVDARRIDRKHGHLLLGMLQTGCPATLDRLLAAPIELAALPWLPVALMVVDTVAGLDFMAVAARIEDSEIVLHGIADGASGPPFYAKLARRRAVPGSGPWKRVDYFALAFTRLDAAAMVFEQLVTFDAAEPPRPNALSNELQERFDDAQERQREANRHMGPAFAVTPLAVDPPTFMLH